jgi:hypothetical protein
MKVGIIGGGVFGLSAALRYAINGHSVDLFESQLTYCSLASRVNQARLHTGLHYPRDLYTAQTAHHTYNKFVKDFPTAVKKIDQYYAIATQDSLTSADAFISFARTLDTDFEIRNPSELFNPNLIDVVLKVEESSFDIDLLRNALLTRISTQSRIILHLGETVESIFEKSSSVALSAMQSQSYEFDLVIVSAYAQNRVFAEQLGIPWPSTNYQVCEVLLGNTGLPEIGITIMDGPFWSTMPFGWTGLHSLTHVIHTPLSNVKDRLLSCQTLHKRCGVESTFDCGTCSLRPISRSDLMISDFKRFMRGDLSFEVVQSLHALKAVPYNPETDARPSTILNSDGERVSIVFSGKIGDITQLDGLPGL